MRKLSPLAAAVSALSSDIADGEQELLADALVEFLVHSRSIQKLPSLHKELKRCVGVGGHGRSSGAVLTLLVETPSGSFGKGSELLSILEEKLGMSIHLELKRSPELLGGVRVHLRDDVFDGSLAGSLQRFLSSF